MPSFRHISEDTVAVSNYLKVIEERAIEYFNDIYEDTDIRTEPIDSLRDKSVNFEASVLNNLEGRSAEIKHEDKEGNTFIEPEVSDISNYFSETSGALSFEKGVELRNDEGLLGYLLLFSDPLEKELKQSPDSYGELEICSPLEVQIGLENGESSDFWMETYHLDPGEFLPKGEHREGVFKNSSQSSDFESNFKTGIN